MVKFSGYKDKNGRDINEGDCVLIDKRRYGLETYCVLEDGKFHLIDNDGGYWTRQLYHYPKRLTKVCNKSKQTTQNAEVE